MGTNYYVVNREHIGQPNFNLEKHGVHIGKTYLGRDAKQHFIVRGYKEENRPAILGVEHTERWGRAVTSLEQWLDDIESSGQLAVMSEYHYEVDLETLDGCAEEVVFREFC